MNLFRNTILLILSVFSTSSLLAQNSFTKGVILNKSDYSKIVHAHIINTTSKIGVSSNSNGEFTIQTNKEDTLMISFIGFKSIKVQVSKISPIIYLERTIYTIEPYTVLPYKNFNEFREAFTDLEIEDTVKQKINPSIMAFVQPFNPSNLNGGLSFGGPISSLAAKFNKRIKDRKHYEHLLQRDKYEAFLVAKFNPKLITQATSLKEKYQINSFMEYCDFTDKFIEFSSHYNLVDQIIKCFEEYSNLPLANK
ncbi:carboxypeptidase-like regulatory domain-containing protein [Vicingaceae bacterium]|nr:carboxypeptidase-like regulatory domain-containing protein [Vicingaceae bacterium]